MDKMYFVWHWMEKYCLLRIIEKILWAKPITIFSLSSFPQLSSGFLLWSSRRSCKVMIIRFLERSANENCKWGGAFKCIFPWKVNSFFVCWYQGSLDWALISLRWWNFKDGGKVIHTKYSKHWPYTWTTAVVHALYYG